MEAQLGDRPAAPVLSQGHGPQVFKDRNQARIVDVVIDVGSLSSAGDEVGAPQFHQVLGHSGLAEADHGLDVADGRLFACEKCKNVKTRRMGKGLENMRGERDRERLHPDPTRYSIA
jgi:hypothetical protein